MNEELRRWQAGIEQQIRGMQESTAHALWSVETLEATVAEQKVSMT